MSGLPASPRDPIDFPSANALIIKARAYHPKIQAFAFLLLSACFFGFSSYCHHHLEDEGMYFLDAFLVFLLLIGATEGVVRTRQRVVGGLKRCGFLICKGLATIIFFAMFRELGNKLLAEKDVYVAVASIFFFIHLLFLQEIHEITDDLGIAQGVLFAAFTLLIAEYPKLPQVLFVSAVFTALLAVMNTRKPPAAIPEVAAAETPQVAAVTPQVAAVTPQVAAETTQVTADTPQVADDTPRVNAETPQVVDAETPQVVDAETPQVVDAETPQVVAAVTPQVAPPRFPSRRPDPPSRRRSMKW